jgi:hypothetical protein
MRTLREDPLESDTTVVDPIEAGDDDLSNQPLNDPDN